MRYSRSPEGVQQASAMYTKDVFNKTIDDKQFSASTGFALATNNNFISQKGQPKATDKINMRRSSFNYDCEQPTFMRVRE